MDLEDVKDKKIVVFDGVCNLCHGGVNFIIKHNADQSIYFTQVQSETGQALQEFAGIDVLAEETMIFFENGKVYTEGKGATRIYRHFAWPAKFLYLIYFLPKFILNPIYKYVAKNRYRWYGKKEVCMMPKPELKARFL